jgi:hypothetical protein
MVKPYSRLADYWEKRAKSFNSNERTCAVASLNVLAASVTFGPETLTVWLVAMNRWVQRCGCRRLVHSPGRIDFLHFQLLVNALLLASLDSVLWSTGCNIKMRKGEQP